MLPVQSILIKDYPQLSLIAWQLDTRRTLTPQQALALYERHWRHIDLDHMPEHEKTLIQHLLADYGHGVLLC